MDEPEGLWARSEVLTDGTYGVGELTPADLLDHASNVLGAITAAHLDARLHRALIDTIGLEDANARGCRLPAETLARAGRATTRLTRMRTSENHDSLRFPALADQYFRAVQLGRSIYQPTVGNQPSDGIRGVDFFAFHHES